jgi:ABC-type lipoprotein release transport system permease subunit
MIQLIKIAFRDLGRNRRRSFFSALALAIGLALLLMMASFLEGEMSSAMDSTIRLQSGHLQIRAQSYDESKTSLKWEDLIENPAEVAGQVASLSVVKAASPRLYATGFAASRNRMMGVRIIGIDPLSEANAPYREGLIDGGFLTPDDREGILIGRPLAEKLGLSVGDQIQLSANTSGGGVIEQPFTIRGIYTTETDAFDTAAVFLPLGKAQAMTQTENHASNIFILLYDKEQTDSVAAALKSTSYKVLTWTEINAFFIEFENFANSYMFILYLIVLAITATVIVNTLIMAVFERTREIGILAAIGMKGRRIMAMFLAETTLLAVGGIIMGLILGALIVAYFGRTGFYIADIYSSTGLLMSNTVYPKLTSDNAINLSLLAFIITLLAGLYPAVMASRMEPVEALRAEK